MMVQLTEFQRQDSVTVLAGAVEKTLDDVVDGEGMARAANYSRFHFQRTFRQATGETPGHCQRRLRLERAGHQLLNTSRPITDIAFEAGFDSLEGFSRAFRRLWGTSPSEYRRRGAISWLIPAPSDIHYDPVIGGIVRVDIRRRGGRRMDVMDRMVEHETWYTGRLLEKAQSLTDEQLDAPVDEPDDPVLFLSDTKTLRELLNRLVFTKEMWLAAVHGQPFDERVDKSAGAMLRRWQASSRQFSELVKRVHEDGMWDDSFMDLLCSPPETFTYGGMLAHVLTFQAFRRGVIIQQMQRLGVSGLGYGDPMEWEQRHR